MRHEELALARSPELAILRVFRHINVSEVMRISVMLEAGIIEPTSRFTIGNGNTWTLLHLAASRGQMLLIQELLLRGASARALTLPSRETPAQIAGRVRPEIALFLEAVESAEADAEAAAAAAARDEAELRIAAATPISSAPIDEDDF
jgi:ankyrin repeat protein